MSISSRLDKGRIDRDAIARQTPEDIERLAAEARRELGMPDNDEGLHYERADLRPNAKAIRENLGLSQRQFADRFGIPIQTIRHWEQLRAIPDRSAVVLLKTIEIAPEAVERAVLAMRTIPRSRG